MNVTLGAGELRRYLNAQDSERASDLAIAWIKGLRRLPVEGVPLRERFTYRGDSLWWFAELYLHKQGVIDQLFRAVLALEAFVQHERPTSLSLSIDDANPVLRLLAPQVAARYGIRCETPRTAATESRLALDLKSRFYTWSAFASRARTRPQPHARRGGTLAFVHSAFWRKPAASAKAAEADEGQEGYIGAVLQALQARPEAQPVRLVGVGPRTNFKARRWWHAIAPGHAGVGEIPVEPIERFASWRALAGSRAIWRDRFAMERALLQSDAIRAHAAAVLGYDAWSLIANELRGVARLQFPWSARAMDEAAAAMEAVRPALVVTYAEAGGWGRALMLEARRRQISSVGLQHGFIYRHWLNYRHEADEIQPSATNAADRGFPLPTRTLVYDGYAAQHLIAAGHFPAQAVEVTGSPALDALVASVSRLDDAERARIRAQLATLAPAADGSSATAGPSAAAAAAGAGAGLHFIVLVTTFTQVREVLPDLLRAVSTLDHVRLVIKPHPAETAEPYRQAAAAAGAANVVVAPPALDLARLLAVARLLVTVNSTVAIDAIALGVPAMIVNLPNNLTPFVDAGVMAGGSASDVKSTIQALIQDETAREALLSRARAFAARHAMQSDGRAAEKAAEATVGIMAGSRGAVGPVVAG
jgi:hypothetical protein